MGSAVSSVTGMLGGVTQGIAKDFIPGASLANQDEVNRQIANLQGQSTNYNNANTIYQHQADQLRQSAQGQIGDAQSAIGTAQGLNQGGDVQSALAMLQGQANGTAPSAAQAQLQTGKDQAIATQQAMANSGNLSQMISGQKTAMDNAANLTQQSANQAAQLRANQQITGQQNYAAAAGNQAAQAGTNAATANSLAGTASNLYGTQQNAAFNYGNLGVNAAQQAGGLATGQLASNQGAQNQSQQQQAQAAGGMLNGGGGALAAMMSDADQKTNIQSDGAKAWQDIKDTFLGRYSDKKKKKNDETDKILQGHQDQDYAALVSDEDQKDNVSSDRAARAKGISSFFKNENKKDEEPKKEEPVAKKEGYSDDDPRKKRAQQIKDGFMSDENTKKDIKHGSMLHAFLDKINPVTFEYKEPTGEMGKTPGTHMGVIAQDVEKAPGGKSMVVDTPEGKTIDMASAMGMLMSAAADAHDRMSTLEELFKSRKAK